MKTHKDLDVWRGSIELARIIYEITRQYPKGEQFGLTSQMRRSVVSIASNIAEGAARNGNKEFKQFLYIALGSASELDTQIEISKITNMYDEDKLNSIQMNMVVVMKQINGLIRSIKSQ